jgi:hypothetical protein
LVAIRQISASTRDETRWEHLGELQAYLAVRPFRREDNALSRMSRLNRRPVHRGDAIVSAMIEHLRGRRILLPAAAALEKIALEDIAFNGDYVWPTEPPENSFALVSVRK